MSAALVLLGIFLIPFVVCFDSSEDYMTFDTPDDDYDDSANIPSARIVGGTYTNIESHPYQAILPDCGGVIIHRQWILTAAHCYNNKLKSVEVGTSRKWAGETYRIDKLIVHDKYYVSNEDTPHYDVMLIKLVKPLVLSDKVQPIEMAGDEDLQGRYAVATGFGLVSENGPSSRYLLRVRLPLMSLDSCKKMYKSRFEITEAEICAGFPEGNQDACYGDSGGPLVMNNKLIGVTSFGEGCARVNSPGVYVRVPLIKEWVKKTIAKY